MQDLKKWFANFDLFVVASSQLTLKDYDTILQAMASGLPVIGPDLIGLNNIITNNKTGLIAENDNIEALTQKIIKLYKNKPLKLTLGKNAKETVNNSFTLDSMVDQFEKIIN